MRLIIGCIGRLKSGPEAELAFRYGQRLTQTGRSLGLTSPQIVEISESRAGNAETRKAEEAARLREKLPDDAVLFAFDERGKSVPSQNFAEVIRRCGDEGISTLAFLIGGADGLHVDLRESARHVFSFGKLTMPHQIVRILVLEQIYRATTILTNHPYHHD